MLDIEERWRIILKKVANNRAVIAFPRYVHVLHWVERFMPRLWAWLALQVVRRLRTVRN